MAEERISVLTYAVRIPVVLKYCGQLALVLAALTAVPLALSLAEANWQLAIHYGLLCGVLLILGALFARLPPADQIQSNEALTVTTLAFTGASLLMSWPLMVSGMPFMDALFEAVSGITTTGLTTLDNIERQDQTFLFTRAWMQWYGGLGFVVLSVALLMGHHAAARRLSDPVDSGEMLADTARTHARRSLIVYVSLTLFGLLLVWPLTGNGFDALLHVLSAVSTGGFSSYDASLAGLASRSAALAVTLVSFLGAVSLPLYWLVFHSGWRDGLRHLLSNVELRALLLACLLTGSLLGLLGWLQGSNISWLDGMIMGFSAQTTAGFSSVPLAQLEPVQKLVMIVSMLAGGSVGSSAGGIKLLRLLILFRLLQLMLHRTGMPQHAVAEPYLAGQRLEADDVIRAMQLIILFTAITLLSWLPFLAMGYDPLDSLFEVASACGTVGLSSGITSAALEPFLKGVLCFDMLAGRVEILALLVVLYPRSWFGQRKEIQ